MRKLTKNGFTLIETAKSPITSTMGSEKKATTAVIK
jgi:hypothetical protein